MKRLSITALFGLGVLFGVMSLASARQNNPITSNEDPTSTADYLWVYNADNVSHSTGSVVAVVTNATYGIAIATVSTAQSATVAGVVAPDACAATSMCFIQIYGYNSGVKIGVANSLGDLLVTSTTGEKAGIYSVASATGTANLNDGIFAVALEATTSSTTVKAFIRR